MKNFIPSIVFCITAFTVWQTAFSLQCYKCTHCNDPFKSSNRTKKWEVYCSQSCMKSVDIIKGDVVRGCSILKADKQCVYMWLEGRHTETCFCFEHLCNGFDRHNVSQATSVMITVIVIYFLHQF